MDASCGVRLALLVDSAVAVCSARCCGWRGLLWSLLFFSGPAVSQAPRRLPRSQVAYEEAPPSATQAATHVLSRQPEGPFLLLRSGVGAGSQPKLCVGPLERLLGCAWLCLAAVAFQVPSPRTQSTVPVDVIKPGAPARAAALVRTGTLTGTPMGNSVRCCEFEQRTQSSAIRPLQWPWPRRIAAADGTSLRSSKHDLSYHGRLPRDASR